MKKIVMYVTIGVAAAGAVVGSIFAIRHGHKTDAAEIVENVTEAVEEASEAIVDAVTE